MCKVKKIFSLIFLVGISLSMSSQEMIKNIISDFEVYNDNVLNEKIFVHTDRGFYLTGDNIWFKVYNVDGTTSHLLDLSKVVYIEVVDGAQNAVIQTKIKIDKGTGSGSVFIPASLNSGNYSLRAYTQWMRNFDPSWYFNKTITVINPFKPLDPGVSQDQEEYDIQFFPEGGNIINGITNTIAFRAVDRNGKGISFKGFVLDENKDTVASFAPFIFGIGKFSFVPLNNKKYTAILIDTLNRAFAGKKLPEVFAKGYAVSVESKDEKLAVSVKSQLIPDGYVYVIAHTGNEICYSGYQLLHDGQSVFYIDTKKIKEGISHITVFDEAKNPVCERLYFKKPANKLDIGVKTDRNVYKTREKVNLNISSGNLNEDADLSLSVFRSDTFFTKDEFDITSYLLLSSDLQGNIESPSFYFGTGDSVNVAVDNLMLTHGWSRFKWNEVFENKTDYKFVPEHKTQIIHAKITDPSGKPAPGVIAYLTIPSRQFHFNCAVSDKNGELYYEIPDNYNSGNLIIQTDNTKDSTYRIEILPSFSADYGNILLSPLDYSSEYEEYLRTRSINMQVRNIYYNGIHNPHFSSDSVLMYRKPDEQYYLDDFTRFTVMEEILREYVPGVFVKKRKGKFYFQVFNYGTKTAMKEDNTLVLLDGVPVFDLDKLMEFDPLMIQRLDVVGKKFYNKILSFDGVVSFITYNGDLGGFPLGNHVKSFDFEGIQAKKEFFSPVYESKEQVESRYPDLRDLLYWKPEVRLNNKGDNKIDFYTSDQDGDYIVVLQGITSEGKTGFCTSGFKVEKE